MYYYHPHTGQFDQGTRRSVRAQSYSLGTTKRGAYDDLYVPFTHIYHRPYDTYGSEYVTRSEINRELIMSSAAMEDNYDITNKSRLRDKEVLAAANRAIVDTEIYSSPRSAVAARRATRGQSTPPMSSSTYSKTEAALIGSKMDTMLPGRVRHPRSSFAQAKMRQLRKEKREDTQTLPAENTTGLRAHRPAHFQYPRRTWERELNFTTYRVTA